MLVVLSLALPALAADPPAAAPPRDYARQRRTAVVDVFQGCKDAVVNISSTQVIKVESSGGLDSLLEQFFDLPEGRPPRTQEYRATSVGSGFVIHPAGYLVTNAHVVARTAERKAIFADGREFDAEVVAVDTHRDLAVLKINADRPLPTLRLGRSADLMPGETVIAIGNPLGYGHTVTAGVVSAVNRSMDLGNGVEFKGLIQTDASINPGNSGGPLLNVLGELIGINTAIRGDAQNIGFAIPVDHLRESLPVLLDVERRYRIVTGLSFDGGGLALIAGVAADSPAAAAGLRLRERVTHVNGQAVASEIDFDIALVGRHPGEAVRLRVADEKGGSREVTLTLGERPRPDGAKLMAQKFGLTVEPLTDRMARAMGLRGRGLVVAEVQARSPADRIGLQRGDVIDQLGGYQASSLDELGELLERLEPGRGVQVSILRLRGRTLFRAQAAMPAR